MIVNTSRGGIIDETALASVLTSGKLASAAVDVFSIEPYEGILCDLNNCILTSHMGSLSEDCRLQMEIQAVEDAIRFVEGKQLKNPVPLEEYEVRKKRSN
jgi:D-3-phosphoglycerate dehydrogenase